MRVIKTEIPGVVMLEPCVFGDERGYFYESYNKALFAEQGIPLEFVQDNHVSSAKGIIRGLHYQKEPMAQAKLVRVVRGAIFDVAVDIRKGSPTFGKYVAVTLSAENRQMIFVPAGFAHGYCSLEDHSEVLYKVSGLYSPLDEAGIIWNDPEVGIQWPKLDVDYRLSPKDLALPQLRELETV